MRHGRIQNRYAAIDGLMRVSHLNRSRKSMKTSPIPFHILLSPVSAVFALALSLEGPIRQRPPAFPPGISPLGLRSIFGVLEMLPPTKPSGSVEVVGLSLTYAYKFSPPSMPSGSSEVHRPRSGS